MKLVFALCLALFSSLTQAMVSPEKLSQPLVLQNDLGGKVNGEMWDALKELGNKKVNLVFYIDPDHRTLNDDLADRLKAEKFPRDQYASTVVINMGATWLPNDFLNATLKKKQKQFPDTTYVKDFQKSLVKTWDLADDAYVLLAFGKDGKLWYSREGKFSNDQIEELVSGIRSRLE